MWSTTVVVEKKNIWTVSKAKTIFLRQTKVSTGPAKIQNVLQARKRAKGDLNWTKTAKNIRVWTQTWIKLALKYTKNGLKLP